MPGSYPPAAFHTRPPQPGLLANGRPIPGLLIMTGPRTGERLILRNGFLVGGQPASDLQIQDGYTSSNHAQFTMDPNGNCMVIDLGSTNGTFINGMQITQQALQHGMTIKIGATEMRFLTE
jgi:pSer/pThr/pTyr-binding forkhead associated (FHA) protein